MEDFMPFVIMLVVFIGMLIFMRNNKQSGNEEPLWRILIRGGAVIILSVMLFLNTDNFGPVTKVIAVVLCSTMFILTTVQIVKKIKA